MVIPHRIHGAAIYGNMDPINIPQMDVSINIPAPWILWVLALSDSVVIIYWCCLVAPQGEFFAAIDHWPWLFYASLLLLSLVDMFNHVHLFVPDLGFPKNEGSPKSSKSIVCFSIEATMVTLRQIPLHRTRGNILSLCPPKSKVFKHIFHHWRNAVWVSVWHSYQHVL